MLPVFVASTKDLTPEGTICGRCCSLLAATACSCKLTEKKRKTSCSKNKALNWNDNFLRGLSVPGTGSLLRKERHVLSDSDSGVVQVSSLDQTVD
ncbi:hypothetical protein HispidOSU_005532 [Sigmodon hispidus]